ncbi:hypothetical protein PTKU46_74760 [Paraburkholderia terrae]|uniref:hypothetical protein n=1 Tax=Paraburkholderia terrae TaxID=311230 RepID=UPI0030E007DD
MVAIVTGNGLGLQSSSIGLGKIGRVGDASFGQTGEQVYVNAANGNLVIQDRDQLLMGQGLNGSVNRAYNSLGTMAGDNWRPGATRTVAGLTGALNAAGSTVTLTDWDGSTTVYQYDTARKLYVSTETLVAQVEAPEPGAAGLSSVRTSGARSTLTFDSASSTWKWSDGTGSLTEAYDATKGGRLISRSDVDGNAMTYAYDAAGRLSQVRTEGGDVTYFDYNASQQLAALRTVYRNASNQVITSTSVRYSYDAQGRLSQAIVDLSPDDNSITDGKTFTTTYTYDGISSRIASLVQSDGSRLAFTYQLVNGEYRVATIAETGDGGSVRTTTLRYDTVNNKTAVTDPLGYERVLSYDATGRLGGISATTGVNDASTWNYGFFYDASGRLFNIGTGDEHSIYLYYDAAGNCTGQNEDTGSVSRTYDANNRVLMETVNDKNYGTGKGIDVQSRTTRYAYDALGHLRYSVSSGGQVTAYRYNAAGQQTVGIDYTGSTYDVSQLGSSTALSQAALDEWVASRPDAQAAIRTDTTYDYRGNVASVTRYGALLADGTGDASGDISSTRYVYDQSGHLLQRFVGAPGNERTEQFVYDGLGRLLSSTSFDGTCTTYQYDSNQHTVAITFANGLTRTSVYAAANELISVSDSSAGRILSQIRNAYDADGRLRTSTDANGLVTHYLYNSRGQRVASISPDGTLTEYVYDRITVQPTRTVTYATRLTATQLATLVDGNGRPVEKKGSAPLTLDNSGLRPATNANDRSVWVFYLNQWIDSRVAADGTVTRTTYDANGRPVSRTVFANRVDVSKLPSQNTPVADPANDRTTRYFYDRDGLLAGELDADGYLTQYRYDGAGERIETIRYATASPSAYRASGTLAQLIPATSSNDVHQRYIYDSRGLLRNEINGEGYLTSYRYDAFGNVVERMQGQRIDQTLLSAPQQVSVTFNARGAVGTVLDVWIDGVKAGSVTLTSASNTAYSLTLANVVPVANHTIEFRSASTANVVVQNGKFGTRAFAANALISVPVGGSPSQVTARCALDVTTNLLAWAVTLTQIERTVYAYDAMNRLSSRTTYSSGGDSITSFAYDSLGNETSERTGTRASTFRYDTQGRLTGQLTGEGSATLAALGSSPTQAQVDAVWKSWGVSYAYDAGGNRMSMTDANGNVTRYYYDVAGRLAYVINPMGETTEFLYDAFGDMTQTTVYATRLAAGVLGTLTGGVLTDSLRQTLTVLGNDGLASRTSFTYGAAGRLLQRTDALGTQTGFSYNSFGELVAQTSNIASGVTTTTQYDYDQRGQQITQVTDAGGLNLITRATYDAFGRLIESTDANGVVRQNEYDREGNVIVITDGTGGKATMTYDAFGNVLTRTDRTGNMTAYAYSAFNRQSTITTPEGIKTVATYNEFGQVIVLTDGRGNSTSYTYDRDGNLIQAQTPLATTKQDYDHAGQLIESTDGRGTRTTFAYDATGRVLTRTVDPGGVGLTTRYEYDAKGELVRTTDPSGVVTETRYDLNGQTVAVVVDPTGLKLTTTFAYDGVGRVVTVTEGAGTTAAKITQNAYDNADRLVSRTVDPSGLKLKTTFVYDANGNVVATTDAAGGVTRYAYDAEGRQTWSVGPTGAAVQSAYDAEGHLVSRQRFANSISLTGLPLAAIASQIAGKVSVWAQRDQLSRYAYDSDGRLRFSIDALGYVTEQTFDGNGNVLSSTAYGTAVTLTGIPDVQSVVVALQAQNAAMHAKDRTTRTVYDAADRAVFVVDATNHVTRNGYDGSGNLVEQTKYLASYSAAGNPSQATMETWRVKSQYAYDDRTTTWFFDSANRMVYAVDPMNYATEYQYDGASRLLKTIRYPTVYSIGRSMTVAQVKGAIPQQIPSNSAITEQRYDLAGRVTDVVDALGIVTHFDRDALGHAVNTYRAYGRAEQVITHDVFDAAGNRLEETLAYGTPIAVTTRYTYDAMGRVVKTVDPRGVELAERDSQTALAQRKTLGYVDSKGSALVASALTSTQRTELLAKYTSTNLYDAAGRLTQCTDALGYSVRIQYDAFGNKIATTDQAGNKAVSFYDGLNRVVVQVSPNYSVVKTDYDAFGGPVQVTHFSRFKSGATGNAWFNDGWSYDLSLVVPGSDPADAVTRLEYDKLGRLTKATDAEGFAETYGYDAFGFRSNYTNKLGAMYQFLYDQRGELAREVTWTPSSAIVHQIDYQYDARGNVVRKQEAMGKPEQRTTDYTYDLLDRKVGSKSSYMINFTGADGTDRSDSISESFAYDVRGNMVSSTDANGNKASWYYDATDRQIGEVNASGTLTLYVRDAAGNVVVTQIFGDKVTAVVGATPSNPLTASNVRETHQMFDADNRLIESRVLNVATGFFDPTSGEDQRGAYYITSGSELVTKYEYDGRGLAVASTDAAGNCTTYFYDSCGQKTLQVDAKGYGVAWTRDAQGNVTQEVQFARPYPDPISNNPSLGSTLAANWPHSADDRVTDYTWDRNGRKISETRENVQYATIDTSGKLTQLTGNATTRYTYDVDGHLVRKVDANGSQYDYTYDEAGRLKSETLPQFVDSSGKSVRVTTVYEYNTFNQVTKETRKGDVDQVTESNRRPTQVA